MPVCTRGRPGPALVQTVDFFTPIVDDPYIYGEIAAANSLSDVYAMGGRPLTALAIAGFPEDLVDAATIAQVFQGGHDTLRRAGVVLLGGHTVRDREIKFGYAVTGAVHPDRDLDQRRRPGRRRADAHQGDRHRDRRHRHQVRPGTSAGDDRGRRLDADLEPRRGRGARAGRRARLHRRDRFRPARSGQRDGPGQRRRPRDRRRRGAADRRGPRPGRREPSGRTDHQPHPFRHRRRDSSQRARRWWPTCSSTRRPPAGCWWRWPRRGDQAPSMRSPPAA